MALAELLGTAMFLSLGCSNVVANITGSQPSHLNTVISFTFGLSSAIIIFGPISGALMNPALNLACVVLGHMSVPKCLFMTVFQLLGGILGVCAVRMVTPNLPEGFCMTLPNPDISIPAVFAVEFLTTGVLTLGLCSVLDPRTKGQEGIIFAKFLVIIAAIAVPTGKYGGCSMNPARSFGPALLASNWNYQWLYWTASCFGAMLAAALYRAFFHHKIYEEPREDSNPI